MRILNKKEVLPVLVFTIMLSAISMFVGGNLALKGWGRNLFGLDKLSMIDIALLNEIIEYRYIGDYNSQYALESGFQAMIGSLGDEYSKLILPEEVKRSVLEQEEDGVVGTGMWLGDDQDKIEVMEVLQNSPAEKAGVMVGDVIVEIGGIMVEKEPISKIKKLLTAQAGEEREVVLMRDKEKMNFKITIDRFTSSFISWRELDEQTALVKLLLFTKNTSDEFSHLINEVRDSGYIRIVLDLRNNPGGSKGMGVLVADEMMDEGIIVREREVGKEERVMKANEGGVWVGNPLMLIVNKRTGSEAEVLASAIQDNQRALLIGEPTFGKGTAWSRFQLGGEYQVQLTTEEWLRPNGESVNGVGLEPDVMINTNELSDDEIIRLFNGNI